MGSDEDHLAVSARLKVLWGGDGKEVKTSLLLEGWGESKIYDTKLFLNY